jgi:hypothetical protein
MKWIKISDESPPRNKRFLGYFPDSNNVCEAYFNPPRGYYLYDALGYSDYEITPPTHWMKWPDGPSVKNNL